MKPQPMSLTDIARIWRDVMGANRLSTTEIEAVRAIIATRDAQWAEMIGEPAGWVRDQRGLFEGVETLDPLFLLGALEPARGLKGATYSPLYAIKEISLNRRIDLKTLASDLASGPEDIDICGKLPKPQEKPL